MTGERWIRPADLGFPVRYYKFVTGNKDCDKLLEYRIEDIPENRYEEATEFMMKYFVPYDPRIIARNAQNDPELLEDYYGIYLRAIQQKLSVACYKRGSDEFIGISVLEVVGKNDIKIPRQYKSKVTRDIHEKIKFVRESCDIFQLHNVEYFLSGTGLAIHPDYRKHGIATEMLKSRQNIMDFFHLKLSSTRFSSIGSQKAALRCGFKEDHTISYKELAEMNENWDFTGTDSENYVTMSLKSRH